MRRPFKTSWPYRSCPDSPRGRSKSTQSPMSLIEIPAPSQALKIGSTAMSLIVRGQLLPLIGTLDWGVNSKFANGLTQSIEA